MGLLPVSHPDALGGRHAGGRLVPGGGFDCQLRHRAVRQCRLQGWRQDLDGPQRATGGPGLLLPNGDRIQVLTPKAIKTAELRLPKPVQDTSNTYSKAKQTLYLLSELPPEVQGVCLSRIAKGQPKAVSERAILDDPQALRYSLQDLFPIVWWGNLRVARDGSIGAGIYPGYGLRDNGSVDPKGGVFFYRSTDAGRSWKIPGRIPFPPDLVADPRGGERMGYTEPAFAILADGSFLCVTRTTDGIGNGPMYASRSQTWGAPRARPEVIARSGVLPRLLRLANGVVVLDSGRPGVQLRSAPRAEERPGASRLNCCLMRMRKRRCRAATLPCSPPAGPASSSSTPTSNTPRRPARLGKPSKCAR